MSWYFLRLVFLAFQAALRSVEAGSHQAKQDATIMRAFNRRLALRLVWGVIMGCFTLFYWLPFQAHPNWIKQSHIHQVLCKATFWVVKMWGVSQFYAYYTPGVMAA